jgi:hypothetical protein
MPRRVVHYLIDFDRLYCNDRVKPRSDKRGTDGILNKAAFLALPGDRRCAVCSRMLFWEQGPHRSWDRGRLPKPGGYQRSFRGARRGGQKLIHYLLDLGDLNRAMCTDRLGRKPERMRCGACWLSCSHMSL